MLTAAALLASTATLAHNYKGDYKNEIPAAPCVQPLMLKDGFYVGAQVGYDSYGVGLSRTASFGVPPVVTLTNSRNLSATGWVGGLFAGYGMYFNNFYYLAGEVFGNGSGASQTHNFSIVDNTDGSATSSSSTKVSVDGSWGVSVLPGLKVNDSTLAYVRLGYNQAKLKASETLTVGTLAPFNGSRSKWQGGFNYGVGMESAVYQNVSLRGEFSHTNYSSFTNSATGTKVSPSDNQYMVGLIYHFA